MLARHAFVVPSFGRAATLDRCLASLRRQTVSSSIAVTTSSPTDHVRAVAARHGVPVILNPVSAGIAADWNFALAQTDAAWVTLAHQDDWYAPAFTERTLAAAVPADATLIFCAADERAAGRPVTSNVRVKRIICAAAFLGADAISAVWRKRLLLSFGDPIPCSAVTLHRARLPDFAFDGSWQTGLDWAAWLTLARQPGAFVYLREPLVVRHVEETGATVQSLASRAEDDRRILRQLWPAPVAAALDYFYGAARRPYETMARSSAGHAAPASREDVC